MTSSNNCSVDRILLAAALDRNFTRLTMTGNQLETCLHCSAVLHPDERICPSCGQAVVAPDEPPEAWIGRNLDGKYVIEAVLGVGGMGMVFSATRDFVGDKVALKVLYPRLLESPLQRALFRDEAIASARLSHPNVVTIFDTGFSESEGVAYIAMELLQGQTLKDLLREQAPMPPEDLIPLICQACDGLTAAHDAKIIHRDLKPDNIFLEQLSSGHFRVKLVDFGIAAMLDVDRSGERRQRLGTLRYMSPEQCRGQVVDARADIYALGVVLYEGLTRRRVTGKSVTAVINEIPAIPNMLLAPEQQLPTPLEDIVLRMLSKDPAGRPESAFLVRDELQESLIKAPILSRPVAPRTRRLTTPKAEETPISWKLAVGISLVIGSVWGFLL
ncbi:MAG: serine/threonine-protein kinase [Myxococcota bacterium]|nr:serine/threonine-protein kinase [Myxococcota bacterium]